MAQWVKNPPCNAEDVGSTPGQGTRIPEEQLSPCAITTEPAHFGARVPQQESPCTTTKHPTLLNEDPTCHNEDAIQPNKY